MKVRPGVRLRSAVCATEVIVVVAPRDDVPVLCGGQPMEVIEPSSRSVRHPDSSLIDPAMGGGTLLGKRYIAEGCGLELLCTRAGNGSLTVDGQVLVIKSSKPLPSSD